MFQICCNRKTREKKIDSATTMLINRATQTNRSAVLYERRPLNTLLFAVFNGLLFVNRIKPDPMSVSRQWRGSGARQV